MGRRKRKKKRHGLIQLSGDPLQQQKFIHADHEPAESHNESVPQQGVQLNPSTMLQLQQAVGNKKARQLIGRESNGKLQYPGIQKSGEPNQIQRVTLDKKKRGYKRNKPPAPKVKFARPMAPGRRRRKPTARPKKPAEVDAPFSAPEIKVGGSKLMSSSQFRKLTDLRILKLRPIRIGKWKIGRKGESNEKFEDFTGKLKEYEGPLQGKSLREKFEHLRDLAESLIGWFETRGPESSRADPVETLIEQIITEIDRQCLAKLNEGLQEYGSYQNKEPKTKAAFLQNILGQVKWRTNYHNAEVPDYHRHVHLSPFKDQVEALESKLDDDIDRLLWQAEQESEWFTKAGERTSKEGVAGGLMNKLDYVKYRFKLRQERKEFSRSMVGQNDPDAWEGMFKEKSKKDKDWEGHRGRSARMPKMMPGHHRRTVAMYKLDQLLGTNVIPPTFLAKHRDKLGSVMELVKGKKVKEKGRGNMMWKVPEAHDPVAVDSLNKLFMLDIIAGQVDRHSGNYMIEMDGGVVKGVKGIDLDLAFGEGYTRKRLEHWNQVITDAPTEKDRKNLIEQREGWTFGQMPAEFKDFNQETARNVIDLSENRHQLVRDCLKGYINDNEIDATLDRLDGLAKIMKQLLTKKKGTIIAGDE